MPYTVGFIDISGTAILPPTVGVAGTPGALLKKNKQTMLTGSMNVARRRQRNNYDRLITGGILRSEVGESPDKVLSGNFGLVSSPVPYANQFATVPSWTQYRIGKHHAFVAPALSSSNDGHLATRLNAAFSGTQGQETSAIPASSSLYYSKARRLVYKVYKLSASIDLPVDPISLEQYPSQQEIGTARSIFDSVSGSYRNNSYWNPAVFSIEVPDYGRIRDLRVWVEIIHDVRGGAGTGSLTSSLGVSSSGQPYYRGGLGGIQISLRSPNVVFPFAHPLWNDPKVVKYITRPFPSSPSGGTYSTPNFAQWYPTGSSAQFGDRFTRTPELLRNSYLLWAGHSVDDNLAQSLSAPQAGFTAQTALSPPGSTDLVPYGDFASGTQYLLNLPGGSYPNGFNPCYAEWDNDIDMRTVFWDGSPIPNPRDLSPLFSAPTDVNPGTGASLYGYTLSGTSPTGNRQFPYSGSNASRALWINSPNSQARIFASASAGTNWDGTNPASPNFYSSSWVDFSPTPGGYGFPWFYDARIPVGSWTAGSRAVNAPGLTSGVPVGWLTSASAGIPAPGPGEFPTTTGSNLGPQNIRAVYPILDDVYVQKAVDEPYTGLTTQYLNQRGIPVFPVFPSNHAKIVGFRPGLRGTEAHGIWQLMIGVSADIDNINGMLGNQRAGYWFRQFRLEFILDQGVETVDFYPSKTQRFKRPTYVPVRDGKRRVQVISGSAEWDIGTSFVFTQQNPAYGRFIGIMDNTGSSADFAVFTRLTGVLADQLSVSASLPSPSGTAHTLYSYLNNEFGTPYIPISSGSGLAPAFQFFENINAVDAKPIISQVIQPVQNIPSSNTARAAINRLGTLKTRQERMTTSIFNALNRRGK